MCLWHLRWCFSSFCPWEWKAWFYRTSIIISPERGLLDIHFYIVRVSAKSAGYDRPRMMSQIEGLPPDAIWAHVILKRVAIFQWWRSRTGWTSDRLTRICRTSPWNKLEETRNWTMPFSPRTPLSMMVWFWTSICWHTWPEIWDLNVRKGLVTVMRKMQEILRALPLTCAEHWSTISNSTLLSLKTNTNICYSLIIFQQLLCKCRKRQLWNPCPPCQYMHILGKTNRTFNIT